MNNIDDKLSREQLLQKLASEYLGFELAGNFDILNQHIFNPNIGGRHVTQRRLYVYNLKYEYKVTKNTDGCKYFMKLEHKYLKLQESPKL